MHKYNLSQLRSSHGNPVVFFVKLKNCNIFGVYIFAHQKLINHCQIVK